MFQMPLHWLLLWYKQQFTKLLNHTFSVHKCENPEQRNKEYTGETRRWLCNTENRWRKEQRTEQRESQLRRDHFKWPFYESWLDRGFSSMSTDTATSKKEERAMSLVIQCQERPHITICDVQTYWQSNYFEAIAEDCRDTVAYMVSRFNIHTVLCSCIWKTCYVEIS